MGLAIGVDVGGTKVGAGVVDEQGRVLATAKRPTPSLSPPEVGAAIVSVVLALRDTAGLPGPVESVGIGAAGFIDAQRSTVLFAPNLAWREEPLREAVAARVELPVVIENDANAMAWAEHRFGAGRGVRDLVCLTVGTGIGGGIVMDGALHRGAFGIGAEFGHVRVVPDGRLCGCGNRGCLEQYASGRALVREAVGRARADPEGARGLLGGADPGDLDGPDVTAAALAGDALARECFAGVGRWLGQGMADLAAVLDPARFVVGGGVSEAGELLLAPARLAFAAALTGRGHRPVAEIHAAALGAEAGVVGAADLSRQQ